MPFGVLTRGAQGTTVRLVSGTPTGRGTFEADIPGHARYHDYSLTHKWQHEAMRQLATINVAICQYYRYTYTPEHL